jgi:hypothetical protein
MIRTQFSHNQTHTHRQTDTHTRIFTHIHTRPHTQSVHLFHKYDTKVTAAVTNTHTWSHNYSYTKYTHIFTQPVKHTSTNRHTHTHTSQSIFTQSDRTYTVTNIFRNMIYTLFSYCQTQTRTGSHKYSYAQYEHTSTQPVTHTHTSTHRYTHNLSLSLTHTPLSQTNFKQSVRVTHIVEHFS